MHRLDVLEADGKPRLIVSDAAHFPGAIYGGKEYRHPNREYGTAPRGGLLFYNNDGDEVGGMLFSTGLHSGGRYAHSGILLDQYRQNEALSLEYDSWKDENNAGLRVWDQPKESLMPMIEMGDQAARAATPEEREALLLKGKQQVEKMGGFAERFYAGKQAGDSVIRLSDAAGRPRLVLMVRPDGKASIEVLDAAGKTVKRLLAE